MLQIVGAPTSPPGGRDGRDTDGELGDWSYSDIVTDTDADTDTDTDTDGRDTDGELDDWSYSDAVLPVSSL